MRPYLAFGSIDSVLHFLVNLSIVGPGVLLPVQKWRRRREHAAYEAALADAPASTAVPPA